MGIRIAAVAWFVALVATAFGQAGAVKGINIVGNKNISKEAILSAMRTKVGQPFVQATLDADRTLVENLGFFQAVDTRAKLLDDSSYEITVDVQEYEIIKEIRIEGMKAFKQDEILKLIETKVGEVFNRRQIAPTAQRIRDLYSKKGFFVAIDEIGPMRESPSTLNVRLIELTVNSVQVMGNNRTKARVMKRLIKTRAGDVFSQDKWADDLRRLYSTQWFENVKSVDNQPEAGKIDLIADVKEGRTGNFGVGLQVDPRSSFAGFFRLSDTNFRGSGQSVGLNFLQATSGGGPSVDLNYGNPFIDQRDTSMSVSLYSRIIYRFTGTGFGGSSVPTDANRYSERRTGGSVNFARPIAKKSNGSVGFRFEGIKTNNLDTTTATDFIQQDGIVSSLTLGYNRNRRDVDLDASRGDWLQLSVEPGYSNITKVAGSVSDPAILGKNFFTKIGMEYRTYFSSGPARTVKELDAPRKVLALRARAATISGKVPFFEQYFAGGSDTVRGYPEDRFWGKNELLFNLEYRYPIQKSFNAVAFVDYGGAWGGYGTVNLYTQSPNLKMNLGYGVGVSFKTPLGPIRIDLGFNDKGKNRIHFQIGTSF